MVTVNDLTDDDKALLELFWAVDSKTQGRIWREAAMAACVALECDGSAKEAAPGAYVQGVLMQCMPPIPCGWVSDTGFQDQVESVMLPILRDRALATVLTTAENDEAGAKYWLDHFQETAARFGSDFMAPAFNDDEPYLGIDSVLSFIQDWRERFLARVLAST